MNLLAAPCCLLLVLPFAGGCGSTPSTGPAPAAAGSAATAAAVPTSSAPDRGSTAAPARSVAMIDGVPVEWSEIRPLVLEAGGAAVLEEIVLDRRLELELNRLGRTVGSAEIEAERTALLRTLDRNPNTAARLLDELRRRQQLGRQRFQRLLWRNAALRSLVQQDVRLTTDTLRTAHAVATGPRRQIRIITLPSLNECEAALRRVRSGESFSDVAVEISTDTSALRGGLLQPFALEDGTFPGTLRETAFGLSGPGEISDPILLENGFAIALLVREIPGTGRSFGSMRSDLERSVRQAQERVLMDQLARRMLREARVTVIDDSLNDAWLQRPSLTAGGTP